MDSITVNPNETISEEPIAKETVVIPTEVPHIIILSYEEIYFNWTYILIFIITFLVYIPFFISYFFGIYSSWYESLRMTTGNNNWIPRILWVVTSLVSFIGLYILWRNPTEEIVRRNLQISVLYLIGNFILVLWSVTFLQFQNIAAAVWLAVVILLFQVFMFVYIWTINPIAAIFFIPLIAMYIYFVVDLVNLANLNNVSL